MKRVTMTCLILALFGSLALAIEPGDPPPHGNTKQQREWLRRHLDADMAAMNAFPREAYEKMHRMIAYATPNDTDLLTDCYRLARKVAAAELRQLAQAQIGAAQVAQAQGVQPQAAPQEDEQAKADREELGKLYTALAGARNPARTVGEYIAASLPCWCGQAVQNVPPADHGDGQDIGSPDDIICAGSSVRYVHRAQRDFEKPDHRGQTNHAVPAEAARGQDAQAYRGNNAGAAQQRFAMPAPSGPGGNFAGNGLQGASGRSFGRGR